MKKHIFLSIFIGLAGYLTLTAQTAATTKKTSMAGPSAPVNDTSNVRSAGGIVVSNKKIVTLAPADSSGMKQHPLINTTDPAVTNKRRQ
jgi:hypothetical protein